MILIVQRVESVGKQPVFVLDAKQLAERLNEAHHSVGLGWMAKDSLVVDSRKHYFFKA